MRASARVTTITDTAPATPHNQTMTHAEPKPLPREHGAWGLLLQPFFAGAILARRRVSTTLRQSAKEFSEYSFLENPMRRVC